jgi:hypothetical protein
MYCKSLLSTFTAYRYAAQRIATPNFIAKINNNGLNNNAFGLIASKGLKTGVEQREYWARFIKLSQY